MLPRLALLQRIGQKEDQTFSSAPAKFGMMPSESALGTMLKVLKWGVVPLNLKGHDMTPHSLCKKRIKPQRIYGCFNHKYKLRAYIWIWIWI